MPHKNCLAAQTGDRYYQKLRLQSSKVVANSTNQKSVHHDNSLSVTTPIKWTIIFRWDYVLCANQLMMLQIWCDFDCASLLICGNKMPTRCNRGFHYRSYCLLNMFQATLCPSSGAQEYYMVVAACGISCCFTASCKPDTWPTGPHQASNLKTTARNTTGSSHCIILLSSWWWA